MSEAQPEVALTRRERKKERTRREIYDAAMHLFSLKGFDVVTIAEICEEADVGRGTFFLHFPTKAALLYEFNTRVAETVRSELGSPQKSARQALRELVERMSVELQSQADVMRAMVADFFNSPETVASQSAAENDALQELVTEIIESGQASGEFCRGIDARLAAASFFATAGTILAGRVFREGEVPVSEINRQFLQITFAGLSPEGDLDG